MDCGLTLQGVERNGVALASCRPSQSEGVSLSTQFQPTKLAGSSYGSPKASATPGYVTLPSAMFSPLSKALLSRSAFFHPLLASCIAYGNEALVSASVEVRGTPPGMLATP